MSVWKHRNILSIVVMEKWTVNVFLICCYRSHKRSTKQKVGIDSIAAPMLLWENTRREERRSTKLVALSIWLLLLLSFAFAAALIEKSPQELLVINTFSSYLIPLSFLCVCIILLSAVGWKKILLISVLFAVCVARHITEVPFVFVGMFFSSMSPHSFFLMFLFFLNGFVYYKLKLILKVVKIFIALLTILMQMSTQFTLKHQKKINSNFNSLQMIMKFKFIQS